MPPRRERQNAQPAGRNTHGRPPGSGNALRRQLLALEDPSLEGPTFVLLAALLLMLGTGKLVVCPVLGAVAPDAAPEIRVDPNSDPPHRLVVLPGVGPKRAAAIVADRMARGPFRHPDDLARVPGIGPALVRRLAPHLPWRTPAAEEQASAGRPEMDSLPPPMR